MKRPSDETCELLRSGASVPTFDGAVASLVDNCLQSQLSELFKNNCYCALLADSYVLFVRVIALCAGATHVFITVSATTLSVEVRDNGTGIRAEDMKMLFQRYYTSAAESSTEQGRGESLSNLAAIARTVEVTSRHQYSTKTYTCKSSPVPGSPTEVCLAKIARSAGTTVSVADLFHRLPVRKTAAQSTLILARTRDTIGDLSVLWPHVAFVLINQDDGHELLHLQSVCF